MVVAARALGVAVLVGGICGAVFGAFQMKDTPAGLGHLHKVRPPLAKVLHHL